MTVNGLDWENDKGVDGIPQTLMNGRVIPLLKAKCKGKEVAVSDVGIKPSNNTSFLTSFFFIFNTSPVHHEDYYMNFKCGAKVAKN